MTWQQTVDLADELADVVQPHNILDASVALLMVIANASFQLPGEARRRFNREEIAELYQTIVETVGSTDA